MLSQSGIGLEWENGGGISFISLAVVFFLFFPFPGLKAADRTLIQNEWMEEKIPVIVATISFGMGVDKANVRYVRLSVVPCRSLKPEQWEGNASVSL